MKLFFLALFAILSAIAISFQLWLVPLDTIAYIFFSLVFSLIVASIWRMVFRSSNKQSNFRLARRFFLGIWGMMGVFIAIIGSFVYYNNSINPAKLANITLQNHSGQTVVFSKMSHIATPAFFAEKKQSLQNLSISGFQIMVEGVGTGSTESARALDAMMGFDFTSAGYGDIAHILGLAEQDKSLYENIAPEHIVHVDISLDDIVALMGSGSTQTGVLSGGEDLQGQIDIVKNQVANMNSRERWMTTEIMYSFLNFQIKNLDFMISLLQAQDPTGAEARFFDVILHERNKPIADYIIENPTQNIAVVYGALHFDGVLALLRAHDPSWNIVHMEPFAPYVH